VNDVKGISQDLSVWYSESNIDPLNAIVRAHLNGAYNEDERKSIEERVNRLLTNMLSELSSISFTTSASKGECISQERLALARRKGVGVWVPGKGKETDPSEVSFVLIRVPKGWEKQQVLNQAKKMAQRSGITIYDVTEPTKAEKELPKYCGSSSLYWGVSLGEDAGRETKRTLISQESESVEGISVTFEGNSIFPYYIENTTLVVLVAPKENQKAMEEIKETYPSSTQALSWR
jgi:hypothetical protein